MSSINSFRTKRGVVTFGESTLEIEESFCEYARSLYYAYWESDIWWRKVAFVCLAFSPIFAIVWLIGSLATGRFLLLAAVLGLVALLWVVGYAQGFRSPDQLRLAQIVSVAATRGQKGATRPRLVLTYQEETETYCSIENDTRRRDCSVLV
jgi:hypothetical protein